VSSEIWSVELSSGKHVVKRALPRLKVSQNWEVPVERSRHEAAWMRFAAQADPGSAPQCVASDDRRGMLLMRYLPPSRFTLWKSMLRDGVAIPEQAYAVGSRLARIHAASAAPAVAAELLVQFDHTPLFHAIRLEPYLEATAQRHPALSDALHALSRTTAQTRNALVHGDISPKNILVGPEGPVFLDAECAWWGDPAFDLAFCLKHLLLKRLWVPAHQALYRASFCALVNGYREGVSAHGFWEPWDALEARAAALLPALTLARVDGKSPVEYLTRAACRQRVRDLTHDAILSPRPRLEDIHRDWIFRPSLDPCA
jgi:5-methylthioribose kinase